MVRKQTSIDYNLLTIILALLAFGLICLYSASTVESFKNFGTTTYYIKHQILYGALGGLILMFIFAKVDYHVWQKHLPVLIAASLILLVVVKITGISLGGASRWLHIKGVSFQPSELAKLTIILYLATWVDKRGRALNDFYFGLLPSLVIVGLFSLLILWQPDFGTMIILVMVALIMLFTAGINWKHFFYIVLASALLLYSFIKLEPYRARRLTTFLNPNIDPQGISYQINQALLAIGAGGLWGYGYGLSRQKHNYLPEAFSDSIFAVVSEELGFFRVLIILILFTALTLKGIKIAKAAPDLFGKMLAIGIISLVTIQALINIGAIVNLLPLTGVTLPFFSYGGTSLLMTLASMGILLNISKQAAA